MNFFPVPSVEGPPTFLLPVPLSKMDSNSEMEVDSQIEPENDSKIHFRGQLAVRVLSLDSQLECQGWKIRAEEEVKL